MDGLKKLIVLALILVLFNFYYTYFRVSIRAQRWLRPWKEALKRIEW